MLKGLFDRRAEARKLLLCLFNEEGYITFVTNVTRVKPRGTASQEHLQII